MPSRISIVFAALKELADTIRNQGILSPLLVRPVTENGFEIVFGARRYRAAQLAEQGTVPIRIKQTSMQTLPLTKSAMKVLANSVASIDAISAFP